MSDFSLSQNLSLAWLKRAEIAANDLDHAAKAPALFKSEFVAERQADYATAMHWAAFWQGQAATA